MSSDVHSPRIAALPEQKPSTNTETCSIDTCMHDGCRATKLGRPTLYKPSVAQFMMLCKAAAGGENSSEVSGRPGDFTEDDQLTIFVHQATM
mmetsp:Transcript_112054/g.356150  ORF Transcript_112054/g.356150 Transcript_112054/m.356150 type:complete len:92 (-) Transcript_112054:120-395(-)